MTMLTTITAETLPTMTWRQARVITTELLARLYNAADQQIRQNYNNNAMRFVEGTHFYKLEGEALREFKKNCVENFDAVPKHARSLTLWTERGAARHAKMLDTDAAWEVFEQLEDCYFRVKEALESKPFSKNCGDALTVEQADILRNMMTAHCSRLPKAQQASFMVKGWSKLKSHFKVGYRQIPQGQLVEALSMIGRHAAEWEVVDELPSAVGPQLDESTRINIEAMCNHLTFLHSWWRRVYPGLKLFNGNLAATAYDRFNDGSLAADMVSRRLGFKSWKAYAAGYPWDGGYSDRAEYQRRNQHLLNRGAA